MSWVGSAGRWLQRKTAGVALRALSLTDPKGWEILMNPTHTGRSVTADSAMQISVVWSCVKILAESIGTLPWAVYERERNGNARRLDDHPLAQVLRRTPNADMATAECRGALQTNLGLTGNGYSLIERTGAGDVLSLYPVPSARVKPELSPEGELRYKVLDRGRWEILPRERIWHLRGFGATGIIGYSPIGMARQAMGLALATEEFGAKLFANGLKPSAVVTLPGWLTDEQRKIARENIQNVYIGLDNAHKPALLEGGMTYTQVTIPPEDAQFLETRRFQLHEICRIYRIPPHMVADLERATFSNIEQMSLEFVMYTLLPWLKRWEESVNRWLLRPAERGRIFVRFNFEGLLRADSAARAQLYSILLQNGVYSRNEVRALEDRNRIDDPSMDEFTVQSNMTLLQLLEQLARSQGAGGRA